MSWKQNPGWFIEYLRYNIQWAQLADVAISVALSILASKEPSKDPVTHQRGEGVVCNGHPQEWLCIPTPVGSLFEGGGDSLWQEYKDWQL